MNVVVQPAVVQSGWQTLRGLAPYIWKFRYRVLLALIFLVAAKLALICVPIVLKQLVDHLNPGLNTPGAKLAGANPLVLAPLLVPVLLLMAYGALRLAATLFQELRQIVFARVMARTSRLLTLGVFEHLHALSLRFHLERRTGGVSRDLERGMSAVADLLDWTIYTILPTLIEIVVVCAILSYNFDSSFTWITLATLAAYVALTFSVTEWRMRFYRAANEADTQANARAVDSLLNYETVKYFGNERFESRGYDESLQKLEEATVKSLKTLAVLNIGQSSIVAIGLTLLVWRAAEGVVAGTMSLGDLVMVNAFLIQLAMPLNYLGMVYREVKQALSNIERMFALLNQSRDVQDPPDAKPLAISGGSVEFDQVDFGYDPRRPILKKVSFIVPAGKTVAIVGTTGAGKSTIGRLLYRFFDVDSGAIRIDGQDIRQVTQESLRRAIGIVPQDTVLFNQSLHFNIAYGRPDASAEQIEQAAQAAHIDAFIRKLPDGYDTGVGERGLKLSGGEKQRVAIARTVLKNPPILLLDEATSALDSNTERLIQAELAEIARDRTTLVIAHRLSTIVDVDEILVLDHGEIVERGSHAALLQQAGRYSRLWELQRSVAATA